MRGLMAAAVLALGLGISGGAMAQSLAGPLAWQVTEVSGTVTIRHGGAERAATRGATLAPGDIVATAGNGRAVMVHEKDFVTLAARSRATVPGAEAQASGFTKLLQDLGNAVYKIEKRGVPHFGVTTPYLAAVVKGTTFSITVDDRGSTLQVVEGAVEVSTPDGGARDLILPAGVASVSANDVYRLKVQGDHDRTIDSPARPAAVVPDNAPAAATPLAATATAAPDAEAIGGDVIVVPVASRPVDMAAFTGGLVSGNAGFTALTATVTQAAKAPADVAATHVGAIPAEAAPLSVVAAAAPVGVTANAAAVAPVVGAVSTIASTATTPVAAVATAATPSVVPVVEAVAPVVAATTTTVAAVTVPVVSTVTSTVTAVTAPVTAPVTSTVTAVTTPVVSTAASTVAAVAPVVTTTTSTVAAAVTPVVTGTTGAVAAVTPVIAPVTTPVVTTVATTVAATTPVITTVGTTVGGATGAVAAGLGDDLGDDGKGNNGNHFGWTKGNGNNGGSNGNGNGGKTKG